MTALISDSLDATAPNWSGGVQKIIFPKSWLNGETKCISVISITSGSIYTVKGNKRGKNQLNSWFFFNRERRPRATVLVRPCSTWGDVQRDENNLISECSGSMSHLISKKFSFFVFVGCRLAVQLALPGPFLCICMLPASFRGFQEGCFFFLFFFLIGEGFASVWPETKIVHVT